MDNRVLLVLQAIAIAAIVGAGVGIRRYLSAYLAAKAGNLATREDIASITRIVESAKRESHVELEKVRALLHSDGTERAAVNERRRRTILAVFNCMLMVQDVLGTDLGDFPMDGGQALWGHQQRLDSQFRRTLRTYHLLLIYEDTDSDLHRAAEKYLNAMLAARRSHRKHFGALKLRIVEESASYSRGRSTEYERAVDSTDAAKKKYYSELTPHTDQMRLHVKEYLDAVKSEFTAVGRAIPRAIVDW